MKWSQKVFPKIFMTLFCVCSPCAAADYKQALAAARQAGYVQSGAKEKINQIKNQYTKEAKTLLKEYNLSSEAVTLGMVLQAARDKKISIQHNGTEYLIGPQEIKIRIQF